MSLYLGVSGTEKVLHIYNNDSSVRKDNFSGTSFHSSMPYLTVNSVHHFTNSGTIPYANSAFTSRRYTSTTIVPLGGYLVAVGVIGTTRYFFPQDSGDTYWTVVPDVTTFGNVNSRGINFGIDSSTTGFVGRYSSYPSAVLDFDYVDVYVLDDIIDANVATDVLINNTTISVNGVSITSKIYLVFLESITSRVNDYDTILAIPHTSIAHPDLTGSNYVTSVGNLSYTGSIESNNYQLVQLVNSYAYPVTSVSIIGNSVSGVSSIGVTKNNMLLPMFVSSIQYYTATLSNISHIAVPLNFRTDDRGVYQTSTLSINIPVGSIVSLGFYLEGFQYKNFSPIRVYQGIVSVFYDGYYVTCYAVFDPSTSTIRFYVYDNDTYLDQAGAYKVFSRNLYVYVRVLL